MSLNIDKKGIADVFSGVLDPQSASNEKQSIFDKVGNFVDGVSGLATKVKKIGVFNDSTPQVATAPNGDSVIYEQGKPAPLSASGGLGSLLDSFGRILEKGAAQAGQVVATREINKDLNKNPPYNLYAMAFLALAGLYIVLNRK